MGLKRKPIRNHLGIASAETTVTLGIEQTVEASLLDAGAWAVFAVRLPGYFPLSVGQTPSGQKTLELRWFTVPTCYTVLVGLVSVCGSGYFVYCYCQNIVFASEEELKCFDKVIRILWTAFLLLVIYTTYLRCSRVYYSRSSLTFWRSMITLVENIVAQGYTLKGNHLRELHRKARYVTGVFQMASVVRIGFNLYEIVKLFQDPCITSMEIAGGYLDLFISFTLCYHVGLSTWMTFLVDIFTMSVQMIHDDLDQVHKRWQQLHDHRRVESMTSIDLSLFSPARSQARNDSLTVAQSREVEQCIEKTLMSYELIEEQMHKFNAQFGMTLVLETLFVFVFIVTSIYGLWTFFDTGQYDYACPQLIPIAVFAFAFFNIASESSVLSGKSTGTLKKLGTFYVPNSRPQLQALQLKVLSLIARVADNPPTISASHFFNLNRHLVTSFVGTVTTYLVVLLQLRQPPPDGQKMYCMPNTTCSSNATY